MNPERELKRDVFVSNAERNAQPDAEPVELVPTRTSEKAMDQSYAPAEHVSAFKMHNANQFMNITDFKQVMPVLSAKEVAQVKEALDASKRVLNEGQWKEVEHKIAEVFTEQEKVQLKVELSKQINKIDLSKLEKDLKVAYDYIDWDRVNTQLNTAVSRIALDSLQRVYSKALSDLTILESQLNQNCQQSIPDTDITIEAIEQKKTDVQRSLKKLNAIRTKKVVHL